MAMRWCGLGCWRPKASFTAVMGYKEIPTLTTAMDRHFNPKCLQERRSRIKSAQAAAEVPRNSGRPPSDMHSTLSLTSVH
jgi:hypothetical protein